jgi:hypothetical protein
VTIASRLHDRGRIYVAKYSRRQDLGDRLVENAERQEAVRRYAERHILDYLQIRALFRGRLERRNRQQDVSNGFGRSANRSVK